MKNYIVSIEDDSKADVFLALLKDFPYAKISEHEDKAPGAELAQFYKKRLLEIIGEKKIPTIALFADENGRAYADKDKQPRLYDWAVKG
ncbi:MAG: hypothetical protein FWF94_01365 [Oscillospiraceae bacterium]|nr:hypothetical protein [Oscillospiraceae bacterium]